MKKYILNGQTAKTTALYAPCEYTSPFDRPTFSFKRSLMVMVPFTVLAKKCPTSDAWASNLP